MMNSNSQPFTPYAEVNRMLAALIPSVQAVLGEHLIAMYLDGSLTSGDFDQGSDIDFVAVVDEDIVEGSATGDRFLALQAMHDRLAQMDSILAIQLEGSYLSRQAIRRYDPTHALHPNIERGEGERLKMVNHNETWAVHRHMLRERGITLLGPAPQTFIDPVSEAELRRASQVSLAGWATNLLNHPDQVASRGYQSYIVLTLCRILYTLEHGGVTSKPVAVKWAKETLGQRWSPLIERAWVARISPDAPPDPEELNETLAMIRFTLERSQR